MKAASAWLTLNLLDSFWPELGLPSKDHSCHTKNQLLPKPFTKKTSKSAKVLLDTTLQKRPVKNNNVLGLENIIKLKFTTNFDRSAILNIQNCLAKNFEP